MSDNKWHGDIEIGINAAKAQKGLTDVRKKFSEVSDAAEMADRAVRKADGSFDNAAGAINRTSGALKKLDQNASLGVSGLRQLGLDAQKAEREIRKLYQTQAAGAIAKGKAPQSMASWLPNSGVSQKDKDLILGASQALGGAGLDRELVRGLEQEAKARDGVSAATRRQRAAQRELLSDRASGATQQSDIDRLGRLKFAQEEVTRAKRSEAATLGAVTKAEQRYGTESEKAIAARERYAAATVRHTGAITNLRAAEEQQGAAMARSMDEQAKARQRNQQALTTAQGRLQVEDEAQAYRRLEGAVGRAEAAKRRLTAAQREVNAAQTAMRAATGNIEAQIAATNRLADAKRRLAQAETAARSAQQPVGNMDSTRYALYDVGATAGMAAAIGGLAIGATVKNFALLETQFATVSRTSGETGHNLTVMSDSLLDMGSRIPVPLKGLTDMAARAAQLGVEGQKNILAFTETMSKFAAISDTVTETEVAEYFGRLNNLTGNMGNWEEMADAVAKVGVSGAATDQQILKTGQEIAQAGAGANYSQKEIIGLAGAFASLAVPPERARSVLLDLNKIMTKGMSESTDSMKALSSQMGISEEAIRGMWRAKPTDLINGMAKSLKDMEPEEVMTFLSDFGLKGARALPVFMAIAKDAKLAGEGLSVMEKNLGAANDSSGELDRQFSITMETLTAAWQTFLNSLQAGGFDAMNDIGPVLTNILNAGGDLLDWVREFLDTDIGTFVGNAVLILGGMTTALLAAGAGAAIFAASMLAIKSAAASGIFGAAAAQRVAAIGTAATGAGNGMLVMGRNAATGSQGVIMNTGRAQQAMDKAAGAAGRAAGNMGNHFATAAGNVGKVGSAAIGLMGGPLGATILIGSAVAGIATAAANAEASYHRLGAAMVEVSEKTGKSMNMEDMFASAEDNLRANYGWAIGAQDLLTGAFGVEDPWEFDLKNAKEYIKLVEEGRDVRISTGTTGKYKTVNQGGIDAARGAMGLQGQVIDTQYQEIGKSLAKLNSVDASIGFNTVSKSIQDMGGSAATAVDVLGDEFKQAMFDAGVDAGVLSGNIDDAGQSTKIAAFAAKEYSTSAQAAKDSITQMNPALEEMANELQGVFGGLQEGAQAMSGFMSAMTAGPASAQQLTDALVALGAANGETGELIRGQVDLYDEVTGKWTLVTAEQRAAVDSLNAYGSAQVNAVAGEYAVTAALEGTDVALANAQASMDTNRTKFLEYADALGIGAEEAMLLADSLGLVEGQYLVQIDATSTQVASEQVQMVLDKVNEVPGAKQILMNALTAQAKTDLEALGFTVEEVDGQYVVSVTDQGTAAAVQAQIDAINTQDETKIITVEWTTTGGVPLSELPEGYYPGNTRGYADGGMAGSAKKFADGRYTGGGGGKWSPAGVVHKKEYVFPARAVDPSRGIPTQDALGRMMQQHYPQAMSPNIVVQGGGGNGGVVALDAGTMHQLARMVSTQVNLNGQVLASSVNGQNKTSAQRGSN